MLQSRTLHIGITLALLIVLSPKNAMALTLPEINIPSITIPSVPQITQHSSSTTTRTSVTINGDTHVEIHSNGNGVNEVVAPQTFNQPSPAPEIKNTEPSSPQQTLTTQQNSPTPTRTPLRFRRLTPTPTKTPTPTQIRSSSPTPTAKPSSTPTPTTSSNPSSSLLDTKQQFMMNAINAYRKQHNLSSVQADKYTCDFATTRAKEIVTSFTHDGFSQRMNSKTLPYPGYSLITENIAMTSNYQNVVNMWINSPGHAANMRKDTPFVCVAYSGNYYAYEGRRP